MDETPGRPAVANVLGLDVGTKTLGVAVSDGLGLLAHPRPTLPRKGNQVDAQAVADLVSGEELTRVVVGLPLSLDGRESLRSKEVRKLVGVLESRLRVPVDLWDERFSTVEAERHLRASGASAKKRKEVIDGHAAAVILQGWLDAHRPAM